MSILLMLDRSGGSRRDHARADTRARSWLDRGHEDMAHRRAESGCGMAKGPEVER